MCKDRTGRSPRRRRHRNDRLGVAIRGKRDGPPFARPSRICASPIPSIRAPVMTGYVHGYGTPEQRRLVEQAEHWRHRLIRDGTQLEPGTGVLEGGPGGGAVLGGRGV